MPGHTNGSLKSGNSGSRKRERTEDSEDTPLNRHNGKSKKTGNNSVPRLSKTDTHSIFTDYDAIEHFDRILLKKRNRRDP
jgi:hypothetical protein